MGNDVRARLAAMGLEIELENPDGTERGVGRCRSCGQRVKLVRLTWCPVCGSGKGVIEQ